MKKALLVATVQSHIAQFHRPLIRILQENGYEIHVAARDNLNEKNGLSIQNIQKKFDIPFCRSPFKPKNFTAYRSLKNVIDEGEYDIISCNTPVGGMLTRLAAIKARKRGARVIYTAHGFHFYKGSSVLSWLLYYPLEKIMAHFADAVVTISEEDFELAKRKLNTNIFRIHSTGVDKPKFTSVTAEETEQLRKELHCEGRFVLLCTGELNANKNQETVIRAVRQVVDANPKTMLLLAGNGPTDAYLHSLVKELELQDHVIFLGYRVDLERFTNMCDVVVSASFREGLGLNVLEGMLCGKPIVASYNRGHTELVKPGENGFLVAPNDCDGFAEKITLLLNDNKLYADIARHNKRACDCYSCENVENELKTIYFGT